MNSGPIPARRRVRRWWSAENGSVTAFTVVSTIAILALAGLALDGGLALTAKARATSQAESAARAGAQALDLAAYRATGTLRILPTQAVMEAQRFLAVAGASGAASATPSTVTVTITATRPTQLLSLLGIPSLTVHGEGRAHPQRGVVNEES